MAGRLGAESTIQVEVTGAPRHLSSAVETHLLRIAQEAVNNAIRHAHASQIRIGLAYEPFRVVLTVTDDGRGFVIARAGRRAHLTTTPDAPREGKAWPWTRRSRAAPPD